MLTEDSNVDKGETVTTPPPTAAGSNPDFVSVVRLYHQIAFQLLRVDGMERNSEKIAAPPPSMISPYCWEMLKDILKIGQHVQGRAEDSWCPYKFDVAGPSWMINPSLETDDKRSLPYEMYQRDRDGFDNWCKKMKASVTERLSREAEVLEQQQLQAQEQQYKAMQAMQAMQALQQQQHQQQQQMHSMPQQQQMHSMSQQQQQMFYGRPELSPQHFSRPELSPQHFGRPEMPMQHFGRMDMQHIHHLSDDYLM